MPVSSLLLAISATKFSAFSVVAKDGFVFGFSSAGDERGAIGRERRRREMEEQNETMEEEEEEEEEERGGDPATHQSVLEWTDS